MANLDLEIFQYGEANNSNIKHDACFAIKMIGEQILPLAPTLVL